MTLGVSIFLGFFSGRDTRVPEVDERDSSKKDALTKNNLKELLAF
jgi:hypothetical protein